MADISKITPPGSQTTYNLKDATAREQALIAADQTTQYNYSSVSSMSGTSGFTSTYYFDRPIPTGTYRLVCTNVRTDTSKQCQFQVVGANASEQYTNLSPTISTANYATNEFTTTFDLYGIKVYCNTPIEITNLAIIPKALYDAGFTDYQPYSLPNTKITPELIELVDNGAKNLFLPTAESKTNPTGFTGTITNNGDGSYTINGTAGSSPYYLKLGTINLKAGNYVLYARPTQQSGFYVYNDGAWTDSDVNDNRYATFATDTTQNIYLRVGSNATVSNYTIYPMICYKSAWDVSQKFVPYRPSYEETVEQVAENENNISSVQKQANWNTNNGVKNAATVNSETKTNSGYFLANTLGWAIKANEEYYIEFDFEKTAGDATVQLTNINDTVISSTYTACGSSSSGHAKRKVTPNADAYGYNAYFNTTGTITISNLMIYPAFIEDATFEPYAMSNAELTAAVQALQAQLANQ